MKQTLAHALVMQPGDQMSDSAETKATRSRRQSSAFAWGLLSIIIVGFLVEVGQSRVIQVDDSFISYRYARNLVDGKGLVYNEGERVEGITNLGWTLLIAASIAAGFAPEPVGTILGVTSSVVVLVLTFLIACEGFSPKHRWLAVAAPGFVVATVSFSHWSLSGMETTFFTALVCAVCYAQVRGRPALMTAALCAATYTRPDAGLLAAALYPFHLIQYWRHDRRQALLWPVVFGVAVAALTAFRLVYYGDPVPNTFYAKVGGTSSSFGIRYVGGFFTLGPALLMIPALLWTIRDKRARPLLLYIFLTTLYILYVGGDIYRGHRLLLHILPLIAATGVWGFGKALEARPHVGMAMFFIVIFSVLAAVYGPFGRVTYLFLGIGLAIWFGGFQSRKPVIPALGIPILLVAFAGYVLAINPSHGESIGNRLRKTPRSARNDEVVKLNQLNLEGSRRQLATIARIKPRPRLISIIPMGRIGYYSNLPLLDLVGLTNKEVAKGTFKTPYAWRIPGHQRSNASYVLERAPDVLFIKRKPRQDPEGRPTRRVIPYVAEVELWNHPAFEMLYRWDPRNGIYVSRLRYGE